MDKETIKASDISVGIEVEGRITAFRLDLENRRWCASGQQKQADFPLIGFMEGKRYELYSDGTFAEVER